MPFFWCYIWATSEEHNNDEDTEDGKKDNDFENDDVDIEVL